MTLEKMLENFLAFGRIKAYGYEKLIAEGYTGSSYTLAIIDDFDTTHGNVVTSRVGVMSEYVKNNMKLYDVDRAIVSEITRNIVEAIVDDVDVISISMSAEHDISGMRRAVALAEEHDILIVCSSGNEGDDNVKFPAGYDTTLSVTSIQNDGQFSKWASYGSTVDLCGFGQNMPYEHSSNDWQYASGTTLAVPDIATLACMIGDRYLQLNGHKPSAKKLRNLLRSMAVDLGEVGKDNRYGYGFPTYDMKAFKEMYLLLNGVNRGALTERVHRIKSLMKDEGMTYEEARLLVNKDYNIIGIERVKSTLTGEEIKIPVFNLRRNS